MKMITTVFIIYETSKYDTIAVKTLYYENDSMLILIPLQISEITIQQILVMIYFRTQNDQSLFYVICCFT